jgi:tRNA threonylcarbamoyl adenosine modification protein YeaZ
MPETLDKSTAETAPLVLGFDTSAGHCAAALMRGDAVVAERLEEMKRGQAERLMVLLEEILAEGGAAWADLDAIGVGIGPGNFTGIRISVSAARGLGLALGVPAVGVDGFEARAAAGCLAAVPAPREQVYAAAPDGAPALMPRSEAEAIAAAHGLVLSDAASPPDIAARIACIAASRYATCSEAPAPLYLRAADAAPSRDVPPAILDA